MIILEVFVKFVRNKKINIYAFTQIYDFSSFLADFN